MLRHGVDPLPPFYDPANDGVVVGGNGNGNGNGNSNAQLDDVGSFAADGSCRRCT